MLFGWGWEFFPQGGDDGVSLGFVDFREGFGREFLQTFVDEILIHPDGFQQTGDLCQLLGSGQADGLGFGLDEVLGQLASE